jgi:hypothetical protein
MAVIAAANEGVSFAPNDIKARRVWLERLPQQVADANRIIEREQRKLERWRTTALDYEALQEIDENYTKLRRAANEGTKRKRGATPSSRSAKKRKTARVSSFLFLFFLSRPHPHVPQVARLVGASDEDWDSEADSSGDETEKTKKNKQEDAFQARFNALTAPTTAV